MSDDGADAGHGPPTESLEYLYENAPCGYLSLKPDGRIFKVNLTFAKWIGFTPDELVGRRLHDLLNIAGRIFYETHFAPLLRMQGFFNEVALDLVTREGRQLPVLVNATEKRDGEGRHLFTRLTAFNATDRRRYERELVEARAAAEAAQRELQARNAKVRNELLAEQAILLDERATAALREEFIAVLGHDLRNPLAAINAGMRLLLGTPLDDKAKLIVGMVQDSTTRMAGLIDNVMDFARGRLGGGLDVERNVAEPIEPVLRQVVSELQIAMPGRVIETDFTLTEPVHCDRRRIGQLASNLLGNALTHGAPDKPVKIGATTSDGWFELFVANAGEPIPPVVLQRIFEPFSRGTLAPGLQGLGLGLFISHEIAKAHGGTLEVVSTEAETRFTFRMPL
ncbi:MAG: PAS domain-containing sensor histidine kinase [Alphaproteobacteria bacterium]|nr:PAS domain-containing sensor histidine kinase [Alphaproteobacteria bacterium]